MYRITKYWYQLIKKYYASLLFISVVGAIDVALSLSTITLSKRLIDTATGVQSGSLLTVLAIFGIIILTSILLDAIISAFMVRFNTKLVNSLRSDIFTHLMRADWQKLQNFHSGDIMTRISSDINEIKSLLSGTIPDLVAILLKLGGGYIMLYTMDSQLALILLVLIPGVIIISKVYLKKMRHYSRLIKESNSKVHLFFQESIQNYGMAKALRLEGMFKKILNERQTDYREKIKKQNILSLFSRSILSIGFSFGYLLVFGWSAYRLQQGEITFGTMTAFLQLVNTIQTPALALLYTVPTFISAYTSTERIIELQSLPEEKRSGKDILLPDLKQIDVCNISYAYANSKQILKDCSVSFRRGTMTALVGETGCGKTTLIRLILALMPLDKGAIILRTETDEYQASVDTRVNFSYVPQQSCLFSGTIRDNLRMGKADATDEEITNALHKAAANFVFQLPEGINTMLKEGGQGLSGGQIQRLAIARALLHPSPVLLLDEVTSSLDEETEKDIVQSLKQLAPEKIIIFVTHKIQVATACDYIYKM